MDGRIVAAREKFERALKEAAEAAAELHKLLPGHQGVPHFSLIENAAHEAGVRLSCLIQQQRAGEIAIEAGTRALCPECESLCRVIVQTRPVKSIDGEIGLTEAQAHCTRCERDFFPSAGRIRV